MTTFIINLILFLFMGVTPKDRTIFQLLSESNTQFVVPKYQRNYVWQKDAWTALFDDISENRDHFLGNFVLVELGQEDEKGSPKKFEVIDGQQRVTSISLLLLAIYDRIGKLFESYTKDETTREKEQRKYHNLRENIRKTLLVDPDSEDHIKLVLSKIKNNNTDYEYIIRSNLSEKSEKCELPAPKNLGSRQISRCYEHFKSTIKDWDMDNLINITENIFTIITVAIYPDSKSNAYLIFETLNNRGQPLSVVDIIKNKLFSKLDNNDETLDKIDEDWRQHIESLGSNKDKENFFRHFYFANKCSYPETVFRNGRRPKKAQKSNIVEIYEDLIRFDAEGLWNKLKLQANIYSSLIDPVFPDGVNPDRINVELKELIRLSHVSAIPSYSLLLDLKNRNMSANEVADVVKFLNIYFIRRHVCDKPKVKELDDIFIDVIEKCHGVDVNAKFVIDTILDCSKGKLAEDEEFTRVLRDDIYSINREASKLLLVQLEERENSNLREIKSFWDKNNKNKPYWTIEHILPKGVNELDRCWIELLDAKSYDKAVEKRDLLTHKIGNLTLTAYNSKLGKKCFEVKKDKLNKALIINQDIVNKTTWGEQEILERTESLISKLVEANKLTS
jgi:uncharacterized protein with ParB-like and HNH nuclease domain